MVGNIEREHKALYFVLLHVNRAADEWCVVDWVVLARLVCLLISR